MISFWAFYIYFGAIAAILWVIAVADINEYPLSARTAPLVGLFWPVILIGLIRIGIEGLWKKYQAKRRPTQKRRGHRKKGKHRSVKL